MPIGPNSGGTPSGSAGGDLTGTYPNPTVQGISAGTLPIVTSAAGAASAPALLLTGAPFTGGTGTTTQPLLSLVSGSPVTTWYTSGTLIGGNVASGFIGNLIDLRLNGNGQFTVAYNAAVSMNASGITAGNFFTASNNINFYNPTNVGISGSLNISSLQFGGSTNVNVRLSMNSTTTAALGVGNSYSGFQVGAAPITTAASGTNAWLANAVINSLGTVTSGGATVTNTATLFVGANTATIGTNNYSLYVSGGTNSMGGGIVYPRTRFTGSTTLTTAQHSVRFLITSTATATLPSAPADGTEFVIKNATASTATLTVAAGSGDTIDSAAVSLTAGSAVWLQYAATERVWDLV